MKAADRTLPPPEHPIRFYDGLSEIVKTFPE